MKPGKHPDQRRISFFYPEQKAQMLDKLQALHLLDKGERISKDALACAIFEQGLTEWLRRQELASHPFLKESGL